MPRPRSVISRLIISSLILLIFLVAQLALAPNAARAATITVTTAADSADCKTAPVGSLRAALCGALKPGDIINITVPGPIVLVANLPEITVGGAGLTINGNPTTIQGGKGIRGLTVAPRGVLALTELTITGGNCLTGCPLSDNIGGGVLNSKGSTLTITNSTFSNNQANGAGGVSNGGTLTIANSTFSNNQARGGSGVSNWEGSTLTIINSTFSNNVSSSDFGGGVSNDGRLTISSSTFSSNRAIFGGGVGNAPRGTAIITNSTFFGNQAANGGGGVNNADGTLLITNSTFFGNQANGERGGGGILSSGSYDKTTVRNTIVTASTSGDCAGNAWTADSVNNRTTDACTGNLGPVTKIATALADNGGSTQTLALLVGSNAIDQRGVSCLVVTDQREYGRPAGKSCDIGAFEFKAVPQVTPTESPTPTTAPATTITVTTAADSMDCSTAPAGSLRAALCRPLNPGDIIDITVAGPIVLAANLPVITVGGAGLTINGTPTIIKAGQEIRGFTVAPTGVLTLNKLTITGGNCFTACPMVGRLGGGVFNQGGLLTITNSTFAGNWADSGGGVVNNSGTLTITNTTFSDNHATYGGAVDNNGGRLTITSSTFSGNQVTSGGGAVNNTGGTLIITDSTFTSNQAPTPSSTSRDNVGGAVFHQSGTLTIANSTFTGNRAIRGGGVFNWFGTLTITNSTFSRNLAYSVFGGGGLYNDSGAVTITNSTFSGNRAIRGSGVFNSSTLKITNSTFSGNVASENKGVGGTVYNQSSKATVSNTIVTASTGSDCVGDAWTSDSVNNRTTDACAGNLGPITGISSTLADNGGPTQTIALLADSNATDQPGVSCLVPTDQRDYGRPAGKGCDIGALEFDAVPGTAPTPASTIPATPSPTPRPAQPTTFTVTTAADSMDCETAPAGSLRAVLCSQLYPGDTINIAVAGPIVLATNLPTIKVEGAGLTINGSPTIIQGSSNTRALTIAGGTLSLNKLTITGGNCDRTCPLQSTGGGGVYIHSGTVAITNSILSSNSVRGGGGAVNNNNGTVAITNSIFSNNLAGSAGGAVFNELGTVTIINSTISDNQSADFGGGAFNQRGTLTITASTFSGNAAGSGGGVFNGGKLAITNSTFAGNRATKSNGGAAYNRNGTVSIINGTIFGNAAAQAGGGVYNQSGKVTVQNTIMTASTGGDCAGTKPWAEDSANNRTNDTCVGNLGPVTALSKKLAKNGGFTQTLALSAGSNAIDQPNVPCLVTTDQRGYSRPAGKGCDIGAFEFKAKPRSAPPLTAAPGSHITPTHR